MEIDDRTYSLPTFSRTVSQIILNVLEKLPTGGDRRELPERLFHNTQKEMRGYALTTVYQTLRSLKLVVEHHTFTTLSCPRIKAIMKAAKRRALTAPKRKAKILRLEEAQAEYAKCKKNLKGIYRWGLILGARIADLESATHIACDARGWRVNLALQKSMGVTGRTVATVGWEWIERLGFTQEVRRLREGEALATPEQIIQYQKEYRGRLHQLRRTAINLRLAGGESPSEIRESTLHQTDDQLRSYVGIVRHTPQTKKA